MQTTTAPTPEERAEMAAAVEGFRKKLILAVPGGPISVETHVLVILSGGDGLVAPIDRLPALLVQKCGSGELAEAFLESLEAERVAYAGKFPVIFVLSRRMHLAWAGVQSVFGAPGSVGRA